MMFLRPQAVAKFGGTCLWAVLEVFEEGQMRLPWTSKEVVPKRTQSECPRCVPGRRPNAAPNVVRTGSARELSQVRIEDQPKIVTTGR